MLSQAGEEAEAIEADLREQEAKFAIQKKTSELLPEAEVNVGKLQALVEASTQRLTTLAAQWERHRAPLIVTYRELRERNSQREVYMFLLTSIQCYVVVDKIVKFMVII